MILDLPPFNLLGCLLNYHNFYFKKSIADFSRKYEISFSFETDDLKYPFLLCLCDHQIREEIRSEVIGSGFLVIINAKFHGFKWRTSMK